MKECDHGRLLLCKESQGVREWTVTQRLNMCHLRSMWTLITLRRPSTTAEGNRDETSVTQLDVVPKEGERLEL